MKLATKLIRYYPPTLGMLLQIKKSNFSRYSADINKNANKLHFKFTTFNSCMRLTVYADFCVSKIFKILSIQRHSYFLW